MSTFTVPPDLKFLKQTIQFSINTLGVKLTSEVISKVVGCLSTRVRVEEDNLVFDNLVSGRGRRFTSVRISIDQEPEVRPHPLVHILLTQRTLKFHCDSIKGRKEKGKRGLMYRQAPPVLLVQVEPRFEILIDVHTQ